MSTGSELKSGGIGHYYDKIILVVLLVALFVSAIIMWRRIDVSKRLLAVSGEAFRPVDEQYVTPLDRAEQKAQLDQLRQIARVAERPNRMFVSEVRTTCLRCGKPVPIHQYKCPFCGFEEEDGGDPKKRDSDGDGIPDWWEEQYGMNPFNPDDAGIDLDGDGFTAYEEYLAGTDPRDASSFPDLPVKLRMAEAPVREPLRILFLAVQEIVEGQKTFQLNFPNRTYFVKIGDRVGAFEIVEYDEKNDALVIRQGDRRRLLRRGVVERDDDYIVTFILLIDRSTFRVKAGETFDLRGVKYRFDGLVADGRARIVALESGKEYLVPMAEARELDSRQPGGPLSEENEGFSPRVIPGGPSPRTPSP